MHNGGVSVVNYRDFNLHQMADRLTEIYVQMCERVRLVVTPSLIVVTPFVIAVTSLDRLRDLIVRGKNKATVFC